MAICWLFFLEVPTGRVLAGTFLLISALVLIILCHARSAWLQSPSVQIESFQQIFPFLSMGILMLSTGLSILFCTLYGHTPLPDGSADGLPILRAGVLPLAIFICLSAAPGSLANVCGKVLSLEVRAAIGGARPPMLTMLCLLLSAIALISFWLVQLKRALGITRDSWVIPFCQCCWVFWTMLSGGIVFREFEALTSEEFAGLIVGVCILFFGASLQRPSAQKAVAPDLSSEEKESGMESALSSEEADTQSDN